MICLNLMTRSMVLPERMASPVSCSAASLMYLMIAELSKSDSAVFSMSPLSLILVGSSSWIRAAPDWDESMAAEAAMSSLKRVISCLILVRTMCVPAGLLNVLRLRRILAEFSVKILHAPLRLGSRNAVIRRHSRESGYSPKRGKDLRNQSADHLKSSCLYFGMRSL